MSILSVLTEVDRAVMNRDNTLDIVADVIARAAQDILSIPDAACHHQDEPFTSNCPMFVVYDCEKHICTIEVDWLEKAEMVTWRHDAPSPKDIEFIRAVHTILKDNY